MKRRIWFMHIPKCAGSSLWAVMESHYGRKAIWYDGKMSFRRRVRMLQADAVGGHFVYGDHRRIPGRARFLTVLREPVARLVSLYDYIRAHPDHHSYEPVSGMTLEEFLRSDLFQVFNQQARYVAGNRDADAARRQDRDMREQALQNLESFEMVGIQEDFDAFARAAAERFGWRTEEIPVMNRNPRSETHAISQELRGFVLERNSIDQELYEYAVTRWKSDREMLLDAPRSD